MMGWGGVRRVAMCVRGVRGSRGIVRFVIGRGPWSIVLVSATISTLIRERDNAQYVIPTVRNA